jgi:predicted ATP-dependent endonuclease of OLD family
VQLVSVTLHGYKRFAQRSSMNVDGKLVAVVGPNEAGKSSFLDALVRTNHDNSLVTSGGHQETTRNITIPYQRSTNSSACLL